MPSLQEEGTAGQKPIPELPLLADPGLDTALPTNPSLPVGL